MYSFLVLLGCITSSGQGDTFGTGFIVEYKNQFYVVSCKHVYYEVKNKDSIFIIPNPKQTLSPKNGYSVIQLGPPYFHPSDNLNSTYDIVVFKLTSVDKQTLLANGINPLKLSSGSKNLYDEGQVLYSMGYPVDYTKNYLAKNNEDPLPPKIIEGHLQDVQIKNLSQHGFIGKLVGGHFIKTTNGNALGKGASGGLVFTKGELDSINPVGVILAEANIELSNSNKTKEKMQCVVYAKIGRVIETLNKIK